MSNLGIVIGGSGFIGKHLIDYLVSENRHSKLVSLDINPPREKIEGVEYVDCDVRNEIDPAIGEAGCTIYYLAAYRNFPGYPFHEYHDNNVVGSQRVIDFAEKVGAKTIVFTSTMSVYGSGEDEKIEDSELKPENPYGGSKRIGEVLFDGWFNRNKDVKLVICRPAVIFGYLDAGNYTKLGKALSKGFFVYVGRKDTIKAAGYVGDLVRSFDFAIQHEDSRIVYNFAYPKKYTIEEIVTTYCKVGGFRKPFLTLPLPLLNLAAIPFEILNALGMKNPIHRDRIRKLNESTNIVPMWLTDNGFQFETDLESALRKWKEQSPDHTFI